MSGPRKGRDGIGMEWNANQRKARQCDKADTGKRTDMKCKG